MAELAVATLALATEKDSPPSAEDFLLEAFEFARPRMRPSEARGQAKFLEEHRGAAGGDADWLTPKQRASLRRQLDGLLAGMHELSTQAASGTSVSSLFQSDMLQRRKGRRLIEGFADQQELLPRLTNLHVQAGHIIERLRAWADKRPPASALFWPESVCILQIDGLLALPTAVTRGEWALLNCDDCGRYFPSYGRYHHDSRPHNFCSPRCRVRFSRSANKT